MSGETLLTITNPRNEQKVVALTRGNYSIGSDKANQILLADGSVSWRHALLGNTEEGVFIEDLMSHTGSYLDGQRLRGRQLLRPGQRVQIGGFVLQLGDATTEAAPPPPPPPAAPPPPAGSGDRNFYATQIPVTGTPAPTPPPRPAPVPEPRLDPALARLDEKRRLIKKQIHAELLQRLDLKRLTATNVGVDDLRKRAKDIVAQIVADVQAKLPPGITPADLSKEVYNEAVGLGPLEDLLSEASVTEIMVNGPNRIYVEKAGKLYATRQSFVDDASVLAIIERIVSPIGRRIDESQPYVDARLPDGSRVNAIIAPLSLIGPCITIRKFSKVPFKASDLIQMGAVTQGTIDFLSACVKARKNIIVSGGTGTGKTTFLNLLSSFLPDDERIVTIEDAAELRLGQDHVIRLEARPPNIEGRGAIAIRDLVRNALRMRPDRIVVGECRSGEALDMLQAMNTGHEGSLTTVHANSPRDVISRLETMVLMAGMDLPVRAIREQIGAAIHLIVHLSRFQDGTRKVSRITEICGLEGDKITMQDLFEYKQTGFDDTGKVLGRLLPCGAVPTFMEEFRVRGIQLDGRVFDPMGSL